MKRFFAMLFTITMIFALAACGQSAPPAANGGSPASTSPAAKEPKMTLSLGTTSSAEDLQTQALERFAKNVQERTGGNITINVSPASQLGDAVAEIEALISGTQDMFMESEIAYMYTYGISDLGVEGLGIVATPEQLKNLVNSPEMDEYREEFRKKNGIVTLTHNWYRNPIVIASKQPLNTLADFQGVKLRVVPSPMTIKSFGALGFQPTSIAYNETYLSLSQGVVDGAICPFDGYYSMGFYEVAPYCLYLGSNTNNIIWMNESKYNQLSDNQKQILKECGDEAGDWYTEAVAAVRQDYVAKCETGGATFIEASDELKEQCAAIWADLAHELEAAGEITPGAFDKLMEVSLGK